VQALQRQHSFLDYLYLFCLWVKVLKDQQSLHQEPVKTSTSQNVSKPKRPLIPSQSVESVKAVTIEFYRKIILWSKLILKLL